MPQFTSAKKALESNIQIQHLETFKSSLKSNNNRKHTENPHNQSSAVLAQLKLSFHPER